MKFKLDENLPVELIDALGEHDIDTVAAEHLTGSDDRKVFAAAVHEGRILPTQDLDFADLRQFRPGQHPGIVLVRLHDPSRRRLLQRLAQVMTTEDVTSWTGCFAVITDHKLRVRRPP
jgi:predicted nuclease of predicted toxin-antitoxin system